MNRTDIVSHRYEGILVYGGASINPNGDPDRKGAPRQCATTFYGMVTPQAMTRRLRDFAEAFYGERLHIRRGSHIEAGIIEAALAAGIDIGQEAQQEPDSIAEETIIEDGADKKPPARKRRTPAKAKTNPDQMASITAAVCKHFWDTRLLGGVLNIGSLRAHSVRGALSMTTGHSVYPISIERQTITRVCQANSEQEKDREMGERYIVPFAVYTQPFFVNPHHAATNGVSMEDLATCLDGFVNMFETRRSSMSGHISLRGMWLFEHTSPIGNAPAHTLFERVKVTCPKPETAMSWREYSIEFDDKNMPNGVIVHRLEQLLGGRDKILNQLGVKG